MLRVFLICLTIVAAFHARPSAAQPLSQVPVSQAVESLAERLQMDLSHDRARFVPELIRRIYSAPASRRVPLELGRPTDPSARVSQARTLVDLPLSPDVWRALLKVPVAPDQLLDTILQDRSAALLCRGLAGADDQTLEFYSTHPGLLAFIYERAPGAFSAFAESLHVHDGRLTVPGSPLAEPLWRDLVHVSPDDAEAFLRALFSEPEGRLAYLFDTLATATPGGRAFALGSWIEDDSLRTARFGALGTAVREGFREWHIESVPFVRPLGDLGILLLRIEVGASGEPQPPARRTFWATVFGAAASLPPPSTAATATHTLVDAAWLLQATAGDMYSRGERLDQVAFGQRVFRDRPDSEADLVSAALRELPTRRMLLFGLERIGVTDPRIYASGARQAREALSGGAARFWTVSQQQSVLALLVRMVSVASLTETDASRLAASLFEVPLRNGQFGGALADWLQSTFAPALPRGDTWQSRAIAAAAGGPTPGNPELRWEGQNYRLDLAYAERRRIASIRDRQGGPDLDTALAIARIAHDLTQASSADSLQARVRTIRDVLASSGGMLGGPSVNVLPPGVTELRDNREGLTRIADDLERASRTGDLRRLPRSRESLTELADVVLSQALISLVYAVHLGDPEGPSLLGANVALRHDFGFGRRDAEGRARGPWAQPRQDFQPGVTWHVAGSLVGLDVALAPLALHRLSMDGLAAPPKLPSIEREAFAANVALLDPRRLRDLDRDRIANAIVQGRARVRRLRPNSPEFEDLKTTIALDGWRARSLAWVLQNEPDSVENQLSLAELLVLGDPESALDPWGANGQLPFGCVCTRFPLPRTWRIVARRPQAAMMAAAAVEINLELAQRFAAVRLPAALLPSVLQTAMQDFVDRVATADAGDFAALLRYPSTITEATFDDYVASAATLDGPLVSTDRLDDSQP